MGAPLPSTQTHSDRSEPTRSAAHTCDTDGRAQAKSLKFNLQSNAELRKALMDPAGTYRGAPLSVAALLALRGAELARADTQERRRAHEEEALFHRNLANFDLPLDGGASAGGGGGRAREETGWEQGRWEGGPQLGMSKCDTENLQRWQRRCRGLVLGGTLAHVAVTAAAAVPVAAARATAMAAATLGTEALPRVGAAVRTKTCLLRN